MDGLHPSPLSRPPQECCPPSSSRARLQYEPFAKAHHLNTDPAPERPPNRKSTKSEYKNHHKPSLSQLRNDPLEGEGRLILSEAKYETGWGDGLSTRAP